MNFLFFAGAACFGVFFQHPLYLLAGVLASACYYLLLHGRRGWRTMGFLAPLFLFLMLLNPVVNTRGDTPLFLLLGRPYTLEALIYGVVVAAIFVVMALWMGCCNKILTGDKFTCLFSNWMPSLSLLLVMVFRMIPNFNRKARQIIGARSSIGKGATFDAAARQRLEAGMAALGILTSWALEGGIVTGDSMRARGYGTAKRTSFMAYRMAAADWILTAVMLALMGAVAAFASMGCARAEFFPEWDIAPMRGVNLICFAAYFGYLLIPVMLTVKGELQWSISRYRI